MLNNDDDDGVTQDGSHTLANIDCEQSLFFLQLATHVRERRAAKPPDVSALNEGDSPRRKMSLSFFVPFLSRAFSHARVHSRAFCSTD